MSPRLRVPILSAMLLTALLACTRVSVTRDPISPTESGTVQGSLGGYFFRFEKSPDLSLRSTKDGGVVVWDREIRPIVAKPQTPAEVEQARWEYHANGRFYRFRRTETLKPTRGGRPTGHTKYRVLRPTIYVVKPQRSHNITMGGLAVEWDNPARQLMFMEPMPGESVRWYFGSAIVEQFPDGRVEYRASASDAVQSYDRDVRLRLQQSGQLLDAP